MKENTLMICALAIVLASIAMFVYGVWLLAEGPWAWILGGAGLFVVGSVTLTVITEDKS